MTIAKTKAAGWGANELLSSAQATAIDTNVTNALDKRAAQTDTLGSIVSCVAPGRVVKSAATGANANTNYQADGGNQIIFVNSTVTANRIYTLVSTNANVGDEITVLCEASFVAFEVQIKFSATLLYTLGNLASSDGTYATFVYSATGAGGGAGWELETNIGARIRSQIFTANGTFNVPQGVSQVLLVGWGGGGGGGSGATGGTVAANGTNGGGGAGGSMRTTQSVAVSPGGTAAVVVGAGGPGAVGNSGGYGSPGTATTFAGTTTATFAGAGAGFGSTGVGASPVWNNGGTPVVGINNISAYSVQSAQVQTPPQSGGQGSCTAGMGNGGNGSAGGYGPDGFAGGAQNTNGATSGGFVGGGAGGGGGAGPGGAGGVAGGGGVGNAAGAGSPGGTGAAPTANSGAGGGGGGGGGQGSTVGGAGASGAAGASGQLTVFWIK